MQPLPRASPRRVASLWETPSLIFPQQPLSDAIPLCSRRTPLLPLHCTPLLQASKSRPPRTTLMCLCATPNRSLSHRPPQAIVEAPSRPPSHQAPPPATDKLLHHHSNLRPSSPPLHEPQAGALHLLFGLPSPVPHRQLASPSRAHHGEPLRHLCPKSGSLPPGLAPWHLLPRSLTTGRPTSRALVKSEEAPLLRPSGPKGLTGPGHYHQLGPALQQV
jgi:hypothetical protein